MRMALRPKHKRSKANSAMMAWLLGVGIPLLAMVPPAASAQPAGGVTTLAAPARATEAPAPATPPVAAVTAAPNSLNAPNPPAAGGSAEQGAAPSIAETAPKAAEPGPETASPAPLPSDTAVAASTLPHDLTFIGMFLEASAVVKG